MTKQEKLKKAFEIARTKGLVEKQQDLTELMKMNKSTISQAFNGKRGYLTDSFLRKFNVCLGGLFNIAWLLGDDDNVAIFAEGKEETIETPNVPLNESDALVALRLQNKRLAEQNKKLMEMLEEKNKQVTALIEKLMP